MTLRDGGEEIVLQLCLFFYSQICFFLGFFLHLGTGGLLLVLIFKRRLKQGALFPEDPVHLIFLYMAESFLLEIT